MNCSRIQILEAARQTRRWLLRWRGPSKRKSSYRIYGACSLGAGRLEHLLRNQGCRCRSVNGRFLIDKRGTASNPPRGQDPPAGYEDGTARHCWVECGDYLVDVTADQFNPYLNRAMPPVLVTMRGSELAERYRGGK